MSSRKPALLVAKFQFGTVKAMPIQCGANEPVDASFIRCSKILPGQTDQSLAKDEKNIFAIRGSKNFHRGEVKPA